MDLGKYAQVRKVGSHDTTHRFTVEFTLIVYFSVEFGNMNVTSDKQQINSSLYSQIVVEKLANTTMNQNYYMAERDRRRKVES